jgi:AcrR family transcriptional regulator
MSEKFTRMSAGTLERNHMATRLNTDDPRVKRTRQLIFQAFHELAREKDFLSISVQDIAERATLNRATFYSHFEDKFDLLDNIIREKFRAHLAKTVATEGDTKTLDALCVAVFGFIGEACSRCAPDREFYSLCEKAMHDVLDAFLVDWLEQRSPGGKAQRAPIEATALVMTSAILGAGMRWSQDKEREPAEALARQVVAVLTSGVSGMLGVVPTRSARR